MKKSRWEFVEFFWHCEFCSSWWADFFSQCLIWFYALRVSNWTTSWAYLTSLAVQFYLCFCSKEGGLLSPVTLIIGRRLMTIEWAIRHYNVKMQWFEHDKVSVRSRWQGTYRAWQIDTPPRMVNMRLTHHSATRL